MPKTYTDDIAPALPSSIDGPFQVVDPSDSASWIKIDPATARILAAGDARPGRVLTTGFSRDFGTTSAQNIGAYMPARLVHYNNNGGFQSPPICIPDDMDLTLPAYAKLLLNPGLNATTTGLKIRFRFQTTKVTQAGAKTDTDITYDWTIPDWWTTSDYNVVIMDNGNGRTYDPNHFTARDIVGITIWRHGSAAQDTFDKSVKIAEFIQFEYTAKEY